MHMIPVVASDVHKAHHSIEFSRGTLGPSQEDPRRADIIATALRMAGHALREPEDLDLDLLARVHTPEYVEFLSTAWALWEERFGADVPAMGFTWPGRGSDVSRPDDLVGRLGYHSFAADCSIGPATWHAACEAAAIAQTAADLVNGGERAAFGLCRPPGHHATTDQFGGYCYLNNAAVAAQRLLDHGAARVSVLDVDYHHGNGTQAIFDDRRDVLTVSIHADPTVEFPWFSGYAHERGVGDGDGANVNLPLPLGSGIGDYRSALDTALDLIGSAGCEAIVVALGVDTFVDDPLGAFTLGSDDYTEIASRISTLDLPTAIVQEGGYAVEAIGDNVATFLAPFS